MKRIEGWKILHIWNNSRTWLWFFSALQCARSYWYDVNWIVIYIFQMPTCITSHTDTHKLRSIRSSVPISLFLLRTMFSKHSCRAVLSLDSPLQYHVVGLLVTSQVWNCSCLYWTTWKDFILFFFSALSLPCHVFVNGILFLPCKISWSTQFGVIHQPDKDFTPLNRSLMNT